jgi:hypothetical protein
MIPALSVLVFLAGGCRESVESLSPLDVVGTYVLERVGDAPVPAVIFADGRGTVRVIADTLVLGTDGRGRFVSVQTIEAQGTTGPVAPTRTESDLFFGIAGSRIEIVFACPPGANCAPGPHRIARRRAPWLIVENTFSEEGLRYYRRRSALPVP